MKFSTFTYNLGQGFRNIWRNRLFSLASIATMSAMIFMFGLFYSIGSNFNAMVRSAEESVSITVFFDYGLSTEGIQAIGDEIAKRPEVSEYKYVSAEEAWETFKAEYFEGHEDAAEGFADDNPLANSANYEIYLNDVSMQKTLVSFLQGLDGVRQVNQSEAAAEMLTDFNALITVIFAGVIAILLAVSVFLISNTITVGIHVRKEEIAIMKLIGAKDSFVRQPFIVEGVAIGAIGSLIPLVILYFVYGTVLNYVADNFNLLNSMLTFVSVNDIFRKLVPISIVLGVGIGYIGSRATLRKHLMV